MRVVLLFLVLLTACGGPRCPSIPDAQVAIIQGYDASDGHHGTITLWVQYGAPGGSKVGTVHEGDRVWVLGTSDDRAGVHIETQDCRQGWIDAEFIR